MKISSVQGFRTGIWRAGLFSLAIVTLSTAPALAQWGTLKGQFVFDGKAPTPQPVNVTKDPQVCGKHNLVDESLVVNAENGGIKNVVVYLYTTRRDRVKPKVHPDLAAKAKEEKLVMDNENCRFEPHILGVTVGQTLVLGNKDPVGHNMNLTTLNPANPATNVLIPAEKSVDHKFAAEETLPAPVTCNIHPWMKGYLVVKETPYFAITDKDGNFTIENLPAGKWKFKVWQESSGFVDKVNVGGKATDWRRGEVEIEIKAGGTHDLGTVKVPAAVFAKGART